MKRSNPGARLGFFVLTLLACRSRSTVPHSDTPSVRSSFDVATPIESLSTTHDWCLVPRPAVRARTLDNRGHLIALTDNAVRDESTNVEETLPPADLCLVQRDHLAFDRVGHGVAVLRGRLYVRGGTSEPWVATLMCTDITGEPWSFPNEHRGWAVLSRRTTDSAPAMLFTQDPTGVRGWYASQVLNHHITSAVINHDGSSLAITAGHLVWVDKTTEVADFEPPSEGGSFETITRTPSGIVAFNDISPRVREVIVSSSLRGPFHRRRLDRERPATTRAVFVGDFGRLIAVTDHGIEVVDEEGQQFHEVAQWPTHGTVTPHGTNPTLGWAARGGPIITTADSLAAEHCEDLANVSVEDRDW